MPDYAADLSVPILDRGRNGKTKGDRLLDHVIVQCTCVKPNYYSLLYICLPIIFNTNISYTFLWYYKITFENQQHEITIQKVILYLEADFKTTF